MVEVHKPDWITSEIIEMIQDRDTAFIKAHESGIPNDLNHAKKLRTDTKRSIRNARKEFINKNLDNTAQNPRKFWTEINKLIKHSTPQAKIELKDNDTPITEADTTDYINDFFSSIGPNLARNFSSNLTPETNIIEPDREELQFTEISETNLFNEIKKIQIFKSSGISGLSSRLIKDAMTIMLTEFTYLLNKSLTEGVVPNDWKIAKVTPIP